MQTFIKDICCCSAVSTSVFIKSRSTCKSEELSVRKVFCNLCMHLTELRTMTLIYNKNNLICFILVHYLAVSLNSIVQLLNRRHNHRLGLICQLPFQLCRISRMVY